MVVVPKIHAGDAAVVISDGDQPACGVEMPLFARLTPRQPPPLLVVTHLFHTAAGPYSYRPARVIAHDLPCPLRRVNDRQVRSGISVKPVAAIAAAGPHPLLLVVLDTHAVHFGQQGLLVPTVVLHPGFAVGGHRAEQAVRQLRLAHHYETVVETETVLLDRVEVRPVADANPQQPSVGRTLITELHVRTGNWVIGRTQCRLEARECRYIHAPESRVSRAWDSPLRALVMVQQVHDHPTLTCADTLALPVANRSDWSNATISFRMPSSVSPKASTNRGPSWFTDSIKSSRSISPRRSPTAINDAPTP